MFSRAAISFFASFAIVSSLAAQQTGAPTPDMHANAKGTIFITAAHAFESAGFSWTESAAPVRVRASNDGVSWSAWQTLNVDHDLAGYGRFYSGIVHFGDAMTMIETDVDVKATFFPLPERRPRQVSESYSFGSVNVMARSDWGCPDGQGSRWTP